jgi:Short C-terminal domain
MKTKASGTNALVEYDERQVTLTRLGAPWPERVPSYLAYPIEKIQAIVVAAPSRQGGSFTLMIDPDPTLVLPPPAVEYEDHAVKAFSRLIEAIEGGLRTAGRTPIGFQPLPPIPRGAYTYQLPLAAAAFPRPATASAPSPAGDLASQLARLAELRDTGALTQAEFSAAKMRLLGLPADSIG